MSKILTVSGLSKKYSARLKSSLRYAVRDIVREFRPGAKETALRPDEFWALDDISFDLERGEALAVLGANGAGKSTLLRVLSGLLKPDRGEAILRGRVSELIELGSTFSGMLTGRENVMAGLRLHGVEGREAKARFDEVVAFAELERFIDSPVQSYSTGMKARLGFATATAMKPDLLFVDEVLAVGDLAFQHKCLRYMKSHIKDGGALLFVAHNASQIQAMCQHAILLESGRVVSRGSTVDVLDDMYRRTMGADTSALLTHVPPAGFDESRDVVIDEVTAESTDGEWIKPGGGARFRVKYRSRVATPALLRITIWTLDQWVCIGGVAPTAWTLGEGAGEFAVILPKLPLLPGRYIVRVSVSDPDTWALIAMSGGGDGAGLVIEVQAEADRLAHVLRQTGQLIALEAVWE